MVGMLIDPETGDLQIKSGSLILGDNTVQIAECVIMAARGEFKEYPLIGAGIYGLVNSNIDPLWCANTKQMLQACNIPVSRVVIKDNQIIIE